MLMADSLEHLDAHDLCVGRVRVRGKEGGSCQWLRGLCCCGC